MRKNFEFIEISKLGNIIRNLRKVRNIRKIGISGKLGNISEIGIRGKIRAYWETRK